MCSIMGFCGSGVTFARFKECFDRTVSRGPDDTRYVDTGRGLLGFHRLAIMGLHPEGMQPFELHGSYAVCNGEIYGFDKLREELITKGYKFQSESDCEILLPLYEQYGTDMFKMLDAEFALIIYDAKTRGFVAARDPIGIRPLYYGYTDSDEIVFASEPKNLVGLVGKIMPFPPGHYYIDGKFVCYADMSKVESVCHDDLETACAKIHEKLVAGIEKRLVADAKVGFLLSGGLDSSLVCAVAARKSDKPIRTFSKGMKRQSAILLALCARPDYLLMDETFDGLDPMVRNEVRSLLYEQICQRNMTAVLSSHSLRELEDTCDQLSLLYKGGLVFESEVNALKTKLFKIQAAFGEALGREKLEGLDILSYSQQGRVCSAIVRGEREQARQLLLERGALLAEILPLRLEEVFLYEMEALCYSFKSFEKEAENA